MKYRTKFDNLTKVLTPIILITGAVVGAGIYLNSGGTFLPAWVTVLAIAVALLVFLSIPKSIELTPSAINIMCVLEVTHIPFDQIRKIKPIKKKEIKPCFPFIGVYGLVGYYGYYISFRNLDLMRMYVRKWDLLVVIETVKDRKYIISVPNPAEFVAQVEELKNNLK